MVRRCKKDAERTRQSIIRAARSVFAKKGVSRSTLEEVARAAGVTRGAVYWHFKNKMDLFFAMREQTVLPLIDDAEHCACSISGDDPLRNVEEFLLSVVDAMKKDPATRSVLETMTFRCEFVDELKPALLVQAKQFAGKIATLSEAYQQAKADGSLREDIDPQIAAVDTMSFLVGLVRIWLLDRSGKMVRGRTAAIIKAHVDARRCLASAELA
jgi:TetR/AcrR family acrAB operon transcriptional repressor